MKIKILSDIHTEFTPDINSFFNTNDDCDVYVIAGDIATSYSLISTLSYIDTITDRPVIVVLGNHDYYYSNKNAVDIQIENTQFNNVHVLNNQVLHLNDITFIGSTGWFDRIPHPLAISTMNDFNLISDISNNQDGVLWGIEAKSFFNQMLKKYQNKKIVCVSHNMPSEQMVHPKYHNNILNTCFANQWDDLIYAYQPELWIAGHSHESFDDNIGNTSCIVNPYGYEKSQVNPEFDYNLIVTI